MGAETAAPKPLDPRGPRFGAAVTSLILAAALVAGPRSAIAAWLLAWQGLMFAAGALLGLGAHPYGLVYRALIQPRLERPESLEDPGPPRFAQAVGLVFAVAALVGFATGSAVIFYLATALALAAAFLNAAFGYCLGCEVYLQLRRMLPRL